MRADPPARLRRAALPAREGFFSSWQAAALLVVLAALPYLSTLGDPFFSDDYLHIERLATVRPGHLLEALRSWVLRADDMGAWWTPRDLAVPYFRPLVTLSFFLDHAVWGLRPFGYHLSNLLLHLCTTLLCLGIARRVLAAPFSAWAAAALFGLHPCHTEAVAWISGRTDVLAGCFGGAAVLCHLQARTGRRWLWGAACVLCFLLALCAKEMALTLPLILLAHNLLYPPQGAGLSPRITLPAVLSVAALAYLVARTLLLGGTHPPPHPFAHGPGDPDMAWRALSALPLYLADLVLFVPTEPVVTYPFWMRHVLLFAGFCGLCLLTLRATLRQSADRAATRLGLAWVLLALLPVLPVTVGERFLYLPSLGYVLLIGAKMPLPQGPSRRRQWIEAGAVALLTLVVATGKTVNFSLLSRSSRQPIDDALSLMDRAPRARQVLVVDLPQASALAFTHALRLLRPERALGVEVLSIAPHFLSPAADFRTSVRQDADGLVVRAEGRPYLGTYIEQAYLGPRPPLRPGEVITRPGYQVQVLDADAGGLRAFAVRFPPNTAADRLLLRGQGFHLVPL